MLPPVICCLNCNIASPHFLIRQALSPADVGQGREREQEDQGAGEDAGVLFAGGTGIGSGGSGEDSQCDAA